MSSPHRVSGPYRMNGPPRKEAELLAAQKLMADRLTKTIEPERQHLAVLFDAVQELLYLRQEIHAAMERKKQRGRSMEE